MKRKPTRKRTLKSKFAGRQKTNKKVLRGIQTFTARELQRQKFPPIQFAVDGLVAEGVTLLGGKPKLGKSWMALDFAMSISTGGKALGKIVCEQRTVLYCALEDNRRRLQRRIRERFGDEKSWPENFHLATDMKRLDEGGLEDLEGWLSQNDDACIIIDTLVSARSRNSKENGYEADYRALAPLQELAGEYGVAILVIHHLRKMSGDDPLDMISGTTGLTGAVDNVLVMTRDSHGKRLYGRGREIEEIDYAVNLKGGVWTLLGDYEVATRSEERNAIIAVLEASDVPQSPTQVAKALNKSPNNTKQLLHKMSISGEVKKVTRGKYCLPKKTELPDNFGNLITFLSAVVTWLSRLSGNQVLEKTTRLRISPMDTRI